MAPGHMQCTLSPKNMCKAPMEDLPSRGQPAGTRSRQWPAGPAAVTAQSNTAFTLGCHTLPGHTTLQQRLPACFPPGGYSAVSLLCALAFCIHYLIRPAPWQSAALARAGTGIAGRFDHKLKRFQAARTHATASAANSWPVNAAKWAVCLHMLRLLALLAQCASSLVCLLVNSP